MNNNEIKAKLKDNEAMTQVWNERTIALNSAKWAKQEIENIAEELYDLNAKISIKYIRMKGTPTLDDMIIINQKIGEAIKKLRIIGEK